MGIAYLRGSRMRRTGLMLPLLLAAAMAGAQASNPPAEEPYTIKPEDVLRIQVLERPQFSGDQVPVGKDGNITAPFLGTVKAEGKTTAALEEELRNLYVTKLRVRNPIVSVSIISFRRLRASIIGSVNRPATYDIRTGDTLMTLLAQGGGPIPDHADLRRATLRRSNSQELIPIDLYAMLIKGDTSQNYLLEDGDELNVPEETQNRILVLGKVQAPGLYNYKEPMTLADAISQAHGEVAGRSRMSKIIVTREKVGQPGQYIQIQADFVRFMSKGDQSQNVVLQPGDMVYVPETNTPDFNYVSALANVAYVVDRFGGGLLGLRLFR